MKTARMYDFDSEAWSLLSNMNVGRFAHGCGAVRKSEHATEAVVLGGQDVFETMEILRNGTWRYCLS